MRREHRSLITGVGGFAGQYLAAHLLRAGHLVAGLARRDVTWHVPGVADDPAFSLVRADLQAESETRHTVAAVRPDDVYHLAALSSVATSLVDPLATIRDNITSLVNLLEAIRSLESGARVLVISSSEVYGRALVDAPIDEAAELRPENPYAVSKATQDLLGYQYHVAHGLHAVRVRPFNHIGPGQSTRFVASSFALQIAEIEAGAREPVLRVGNLAAQRDFTDVRDMMRAYHLALEHGEAGEVYNLGRDAATSIQHILDHLRSRSRSRFEIKVDPALHRPIDAPIQVCDSSRFRRQTGWAPRIPIEATLDDMLAFWRAQVAARRAGSATTDLLDPSQERIIPG
jgi:GDP-4-dehydro-6-deoxy-D-mannose reductase